MLGRRSVHIESSSGPGKDNTIGVNIDGGGSNTIQQKLFFQNVFAVFDQKAFDSDTESFDGLLTIATNLIKFIRNTTLIKTSSTLDVNCP